ncbi:MAG: hypothetical protein DMG24_15245 [Acidobacteria bacterium]|nr:MAG: hypothetical protein DMG24_15245 [Acidobacteriota bacterium]
MLPNPTFDREALMRPSFCLILIMLSMAVAARAEVVILKNGDRLTGHWTSVIEGKVMFKSDVLGDVSIPIDQIGSFAPEETVVVLLPKGQTVSGNLTVADGAKLEVRNAGTTRTFAAASVEAIYPEAVEGAQGSRMPWRNWRFNGNLGYSLLRGDRTATTASLGMDAVRRQPNLPGLRERWRTNFSASALIADTREFTGVHTSANAAAATLRQDFLFTVNNFVFVLGQVEHNEAQSLDIRQTYGTGVGRDLIHNPRAVFSALAGITVVRERFQTLEPRTSSEALAGEKLSLKITDRIGLDHQLNFYPGLSRAGEYRLDGSLLLSTHIVSWLSLTTGVTDHYLSQPLAGHHNNETLLTTGVGFNFGK